MNAKTDAELLKVLFGELANPDDVVRAFAELVRRYGEQQCKHDKCNFMNGADRLGMAAMGSRLIVGDEEGDGPEGPERGPDFRMVN
jgi:hypothetical protein